MRAAAESGYVSALEVYTGKERDNVEQGLDSKVVLSLTSSEEYLQTHSLTVSSAVLVFSLIFSKLGHMPQKIQGHREKHELST